MLRHTLKKYYTLLKRKKQTKYKSKHVQRKQGGFDTEDFDKISQRVCCERDSLECHMGYAP